MIKNYIKIAFRNIWKNKTFSFINVFGLATGIACCMLIAVYVNDELSYDKYPAQASQIYRVGIHAIGGSGDDTYPNADVAVGGGMAATFPEIKTFARLSPQTDMLVLNGDKKIKERHFAFADSNFLQLFSIPFIEGDPVTALAAPNSFVITRAIAKKYFGESDAMGKMLTVGRYTLSITGIIDKIPDNSHFHFDGFMSMSTLVNLPNTWSNVGFYTYVELNKGTDPKKLEAKFPALVAKYVVPEVQHDMGVSLAEAQKSVNSFRFFLQPLEDIHLHGNTKYELEANGDMTYVYIFSALAFFILLLACVNFTNLSTASSSRRAKEVGVRKVMGSQQRELIFQFLTESILLTYLAIFFSFFLVYASLPGFDQLAGKHVSLAYFFTPKALAVILLLGLLVGTVAGIYPAFFLSSFKPVSILKNVSTTSTGKRTLLRNGLVVLQFAVSTSLIIATIIVYRQLHFMQNKKLGYDKEQVVYLEDTYMLGDRNIRDAFKQTLLQDSRIVSASSGTNVPGNGDIDGTQAFPKDKQDAENGSEIHTDIYHVDYDYIPTLGLNIIQGRNFSRDFSTDSFAVIINQSEVRELGWANTNPLGNTIVTSGQHAFKVIGVVEDFHYTSVKQKIAPLMLQLGRTRSGLIVKIKTTDVPGLLADIKKQWDHISPGAAFSYYFLDDKFASLYASEQKTGQIFTVFTVIAIIIAGLGLFGLAAYITQQRKKEIGIRKVLGASARQLLVLVTKEFLLLVVIAIIIAVPVTWWGMHAWLQEFAYRINIGWWIFLLAGTVAILIAILTVSFEAIRATIANPVKSLRTE